MVTEAGLEDKAPAQTTFHLRGKKLSRSRKVAKKKRRGIGERERRNEVIEVERDAQPYLGRTFP